MPTTYRADQVGSLLRPAPVLEGRAAHAAGRLSLPSLRAIEDAAILEVLEMQRQAGMSVVTDGEYRRSSWTNAFTDFVDGLTWGEQPIRMRAVHDTAEQAAAPAARALIITGELKAKGRLAAHEAAFLRAHARVPYKITLPAPSYIAARTYRPGVSDAIYPNRAAALADVASITGGEIRALAADGVPYVQLDNPHYPDYVNETFVTQMRAIGIDPERAIRDDIEGDNAALRGLDRSTVTIGMHLCRGNGPTGGWMTRGGYDRIAEQVFGGVDVDVFLLEYDSERAGTFEPLRFVPANRTVVLGLLTTKAGLLESQDVLRRRIDEASRYVPLERLALSPQCGFASNVSGPCSPDEQRRKLELVVDTARKVWG